MTRDSIHDTLRDLIGNNRAPIAVMMTDSNPLAPSTPTRGVFGVSTWASTTKHASWTNPPEGWDTLVAREEADGEINPFVVIWDGGKGYCIDIDSDCYVGLFYLPSDSEVEEAADYLADELEAYYD